MDQTLEESFAWALWPNTPEHARFRGQPAFHFGNPQAAVNDRDITDVFHPRVYGYAPRTPNGRAALVLAGGGYTRLVVGYEGVEVARWLCSLGFHAFVLVHRFPCERWAVEDRSGSQAPVDDAIEAMRQIRARCAEWGVAPDAIGVVGLSSGGHLAACLVSNYPREWRAPASAYTSHHRPDFLVVGYAPISTNATGRTVIPGKPPLPPPEKQALYQAMQPDVQLVDHPPPAFIVYSANDAVVPVTNAHRLHEALLAKGGAAELHVFADAPHGFALRKNGRPVDAWPDLCETWLRAAKTCP
jgi:acetyl esterase/lipase